MDVAALVARESIRDLVARYNAYGDSGLFDRLIDLFAADAVLELADGEHRGLDAIRSVFTGTRDRGAGYIRHHTATHQIDLHTDTTASGRCYFSVLTTVGLDHWGRYLDRYESVDGAWRFAHRKVVVDGFSEDSLFAD